MNPAELMELGLKLFPVSQHKRPTISGWQDYAIRATVDDIRREWRKGVRAFGIYLKPSRLVVFDADDESANAWAEHNLPETPMMTLTRRGSHRYYRLPHGAPCPKDNRPVVDVPTLDRKAKGYVIAPGSTLRGFEYKEVTYWDTPFDELPEYPSDMFPERVVERCDIAVPDMTPTDTTRNIVSWYVDNSEDSVSGSSGSKVLKRSASFFVNGLAMDQATALSCLARWNKIHAIPEWSQRELLHAIETSVVEGTVNGRPRGWAYTDWAKV